MPDEALDFLARDPPKFFDLLSVGSDHNPFLAVAFDVQDRSNVQRSRSLAKLLNLTGQRVRQFITGGKSFAMETTLSGRTYRLLLKQAKDAGFATHLDFLVLPSVEDSIRRVANRVLQGGHHVPEVDLRRRFRLGLQNLFSLYRPFCDTWNVYLNADDATLVAHGTPETLEIDHHRLFDSFVREFNLKL